MIDGPIRADWSADPPYTNHPDCPDGTPPYGVDEYTNRVTLDGQDVSHLRILRLATGLLGWIEFAVLDDDGHLVIENDRLKTGIKHGYVEWEPFPAPKPIIVEDRR